MKSAMGGGKARALCPEAVVVPPVWESYSQASKDVFAHAPGSRGAADYRALYEELEACGFFAPLAAAPAQRAAAAA